MEAAAEVFFVLLHCSVMCGAHIHKEGWGVVLAQTHSHSVTHKEHSTNFIDLSSPTHSGLI